MANDYNKYIKRIYDGSSFKKESDWTSSNSVELDDGQNLEDKLAWKLLTYTIVDPQTHEEVVKSYFTGTEIASVTSSASEFVIKCNVPNTADKQIIINLPIITSEIDSQSSVHPEQFYRSGWFQSKGANDFYAGAMANYKVQYSSSPACYKVTLENMYLNGDDVTSTTNWAIYFR